MSGELNRKWGKRDIWEMRDVRMLGVRKGCWDALKLIQGDTNEKKRVDKQREDGVKSCLGYREKETE